MNYTAVNNAALTGGVVVRLVSPSIDSNWSEVRLHYEEHWTTIRKHMPWALHMHAAGSIAYYGEFVQSHFPEQTEQ